MRRLRDAVYGLIDGLALAIRGAVLCVVHGFDRVLMTGIVAVGRSLIKILLQMPLDIMLMIGVRLISSIQTLIGIEPAARKLRAEEIEILSQIFGNSVDYSRVEIKEGNCGLLSITGRPFTHGNRIFIPKSSLSVGVPLLVHEITHVWQHQRFGTEYMSAALWAQFFGDGYDFEIAIARGKPFENWNPEQQADFIEQAYVAGYFETGLFIYNGKDLSSWVGTAGFSRHRQSRASAREKLTAENAENAE